MPLPFRILPIARDLSYTDRTLTLGVAGKALCRIEAALPDDALARAAAAQADARIRALLGAPVLDGALPVRLRVSDQAPEGVKNAEQAYLLEADDTGITVTGYGVPGLYYGVTTLCGALSVRDGVLTLPHMHLLDWPDMKTRGHFMECRYGSNLMTLSDWKDVVDHMAAYKQNQLVVALYGCWCVQYDGRVSEYLYVPIKKYPKLETPVVTRYYSPAKGEWVDGECLPPMFEEDFFGELIAYGKLHGVEVLPLFNSYGHNTLIPAQYPEVSALDEEGKPSLSGFCTSNAKTYEMLFDIYDEIIDRYLVPNGIDSFHVGLDEVWDGLAQNAQDIFRKRSPWCKCAACTAKTREELFIDHAIRIANHLKGRGIKNIYMYHDMLIGHGSGTHSSTEGDSCEDMMKALRENDLMEHVVIDWWTYSSVRENLMFQTTRPDLGLRATVKPWNGYYHWNILSNSLKNTRLLAEMGVNEGVEGMQSYSAWDKSYDRNHAAQADYAWNYAGTGSEREMTDHYTRHHFGTQYEKARRAMALLDLVVEDRRGGEPDASMAEFSKYSILMSTLSYYFYSYVREGKPYPRIFPGEALQKLTEKREQYERALYEITTQAGEGRRLMLEVAADSRVDTAMARRYAYEFGNFKALADDYIALLEMADIAQSACTVKYARIRAKAEERRDARVALMAECEREKEQFLMASHMRNHSIFMQFFADLAAYIARTSADEIRLDFMDMGYLASEAFWRLR